MISAKSKSSLFNIIALFLGCIIGCVLNVGGHTEIVNSFISPFGSLYVRVLQFVALPMIFCLVIVSIASLPSLKKIFSLAIESVICNVTFGILMGIISFLVAVFFVSRRYLLLTSTAFASKNIVSAQNYMDRLMNKVPSGIVGAFMQKNLFFVLVSAILLGILVALEREKLKYLTGMIVSINSVLKNMIDIIIRFAPIGIFALTANAFASNDLGVFKSLFGAICMVSVIALIFIIVAIALASFITKRSFCSCLEVEYPTIFFGFVTAASSACIPLIQKSSEELDCRRETSSFVVPLTSLLIKSGIVMDIYCSLSLVIVASGNVMPLYKWFYMIFLAIGCSLAAPPIPMCVLFVIPTAIAYLGLNVDQNLLVLVIAVCTFNDMLSTSATCAANILCSLIVDKIELHKTKKQKLI